MTARQAPPCSRPALPPLRERPRSAAHRRDIVYTCSADPATLQEAVRACSEAGASRVMVVPLNLSSSRGADGGGGSVAFALAEVQRSMPGMR